MGQQAFDFVFTNSAVDFEAFRGLTENKYVFSATYVKDISENAGVLLSYDRCYTSDNIPEKTHSDTLKGGFTLKTSLYPLRRWNPDTKFRLDVGVFAEAGTITSGQNNGSPVNVEGAYLDYNYKAFEIGLLYQNRTEDDYFSGNYIGAHAGWRF